MPELEDSLSPEQILKNKEISGGHKYDDPSDLKVTPVETPEHFNLSNNKPVDQINDTALPEVKPEQNYVLDLGWKNLPVTMLPSRGLFYPEGTKIAIRPADVKEIRQFSTIDEDDMLDIDEKLNLIIDACCRMNFSSEGVVSYKDLKQEDRFFIIMTIRDLTFVKGENRIIISPDNNCNTDGCKGVDAIELRTGVLSNYILDEKLMKFYSMHERKFVFPIKRTGTVIKMGVPSIGVTKQISDFVKRSVRKGIDVDESFIKIAPFYFDEWRDIDDIKIRKAMLDSESWSKEEFSAYFQLSEKIKIGTKLNVTVVCDKCGEGEVTAPIYFPGGFRSLFLISDIFGELL
jgi:hypothetical protein